MLEVIYARFVQSTPWSLLSSPLQKFFHKIGGKFNLKVKGLRARHKNLCKQLRGLWHLLQSSELWNKKRPPLSFTQGVVLIARVFSFEMTTLTGFLDIISLTKNMFSDYIVIYLLLGLNNLSFYTFTEILFPIRFHSAILIVSYYGIPLFSEINFNEPLIFWAMTSLQIITCKTEPKFCSVFRWGLEEGIYDQIFIINTILNTWTKATKYKQSPASYSA